jgi:hypothetical protein
MSRLATFLENELLAAKFPPPFGSETEPGYTARVITPFIQNLISGQSQSRGIWVKGDGATRQAYAKTFMGLRFHPDLAVGQNERKHWCAEVKLVRKSLTGDVLTKAIGQAQMYKDVFECVTVVLIVNKNSNKKLEHCVQRINPWLNVVVLTEFESKWD